jgi:hypothetical protein
MAPMSVLEGLLAPVLAGSTRVRDSVSSALDWNSESARPTSGGSAGTLSAWAVGLLSGKALPTLRYCHRRRMT